MTASAGPGLALTVTASPTSVSRPGQSDAYTFVARNRGDQTLQNVLVTAPFPGLSALVCSPVRQGGTLAPGATTTCRATRTLGVADLRSDALENTAKVEATTLTGTRVANVGSVSVEVKALAPTVSDDTARAVNRGPDVFLPGATNDGPGEVGGAAIDPSRTVFVGDDPRSPFGGKRIQTTYALWSLLPDGSVRMRPLLDGNGTAVAQADYRVYDTAGRSSVGHLTVTIRKGAAAGANVTVTTLQNRPVTVDVLSHDDPGQKADGTPSSFDRASLRLTGISGAGEFPDLDPVTYGEDGRSVSFPLSGTYTVTSDGRITFTPVPGFAGTPPTVRYTARSLAGSSETNYLVPTVKAVTPTAGEKTATVTYGREAVLAVAAGAKAGDPSAPIVPASVVLTAATATDAGKTLGTSSGTWRVQTDGSVRFTPADGFVGTTAPVEYAVADRNGTRATSTMTVTARPAPTTVPDRTTTPKGAAVSLTPLSNDVAGVEADGSPGSFVTASLAFPAAGQPAGATVSDAGHTLSVPSEGVWRVGSGVVSFAPTAGFVGGATPVSYTATDDLGNVATGRIRVAVTSSTPAATDDEAVSVSGTSVRLPAAADDSPGSSPLVLASTVFPTAGQPASATVSSDGKTLTVPSQGAWTLAADGTATFAPVSAFAGMTTPVTYRVTDRAGRAASATLVVTGRPGPTGTPDVVPPQGDRVVVPLTENDDPGRSADGSLGTIDPLTLRFAPTGQPKGWTISEDRRLAAYYPNPKTDGIGQTLSIDSTTGVVTATIAPNVTAVVGPIVYTAQNTVRDASGAARHRTLTSTVRVGFTAVGPVATDDHAVTTTQVAAFLAGQTNDLAAPGPYGLKFEGASFPTDQLGRLPAGSRVDGDQLVVAGEGTYEITSVRGEVEFTASGGFTGDTTPVDYQITDELGSHARASLTVTVLPGAVTRPDTATTPQDVPVTVDVLANDDPGPSLTGGRATWSDYGNVNPVLTTTGLPPGSKLSNYGDQLTVPGQGVYSVNPGSHAITFDPVSSFRGAATLVTVSPELEVDRPFDAPTYVSVGLTSTLRVTVVGADPVARPDQASTRSGQPVVVRALANDTPGSPTAPLVGSSIRLRLAPGLPAGSTLSGDVKLLTVAGRGWFLAAGNGEITFVPLGGTTGPVPTVGYQVADANGSTSRSTLTVTVS